MNYVLENLKFEDLESLKNIYDESFNKNSNIEIMKTKFESVNKLDNTKMLCIKVDNKLAGFLKCDIIDDFVSDGKPYMFLSDLCVSKQFQGNGYSKILLEKAEKIAKNMNCGYIFLTCGDGRICAHSIYKKMGYNIKNSSVFIKFI